MAVPGSRKYALDLVDEMHEEDMETTPDLERPRFFDPQRLPERPLGSDTLTPKPVLDVDSAQVERTGILVHDAIRQKADADAARDIYTDESIQAEFGGGPGVGAMLNLPDKDDPTHMAFAEFQKDWDTAAMVQATGDPAKTFRNVANFLFSDEMGLMGMKWDKDGFSWAWDNFSDQITEHPISTSVTLASYMVPIGAAWMKGSRIAKHALTLATEGADVGAAAGKGLLGSTLRYRFDDHARLVKSLAGSATATDGRQLFNPAFSQKLVNSTPEEIRKLVPESDLRKILIGDYHQARYLELASMAKSGALDSMEGVKGHAMRTAWWFRRNFTNKYMLATQNMGIDHIKNIDDFYKSQNYAALLAAMPTNLGKANADIAYKYMMGEETADVLKKAIGDDNFNAVDSLIGRWRDLWNEQLGEGFLDDATEELFAVGKGKLDTGFHLPAVKAGTAGFEDLGLLAQSVKPSKYGTLVRQNRFDPAKALTGPTTKHRAKLVTRQAVLEALPGLITDPSKLAVGGFVKDATVFQLHRGFRDMITTSLRGDRRATHWIRSAAEYDAMGSIAKKNFVSIDDLDSVVPGLAARMRKMVLRDLDKTGQRSLLDAGMPVIDKDLVEKFFGSGPGSGAWSASMAGIFAEMLTNVHKTAATSLNPPTHMANTLGNFMFLAQAGMNPFSREALNDAGMFTRAFASVAKQHARNPDKPVEMLFNFDNLKSTLGKDRYIKDTAGNRIDLAELLSNDIIKDGLLETQAFETVEGFNSLKKTLNYLQASGDSGITATTAKTVGTAIAGVGELPVIKPTLQTLSAMYLAEDLIPKMMYVSNLARKGWGVDAILQEVGRRLPQYRTVGDIPDKARRVVLPWITFTAEAARITKNNIMDHPVSMMAWLQAPQAMQAVASGAGVGVDYSDYDAALDALPSWAHRPSTVMLKEEAAAPTLGAVSGAAMGGVAGTAVGGFRGGIAGALLGAAGGAALGAQSPRHEEMLASRKVGMENWSAFARGWAVDFLPYSALLPTSLHPHEWEKVNPFNESPKPGMESIQTAIDLSPVEPFAIAKPIIDLMSGRNSFGQEIKTKSGIEWANKFALGLLGFISPPMMQKYGMNLSTPDGLFRMTDTHKAVGERMTLPKSTVATFGGLLGSSLTFYGAKRLGVPTGQAARAAALAGGVGTMSGAAVNTRRLMTDLGLMPNPQSREPGDWTLDFFVNTFLGTGKSWKASPNQHNFNDELRSRRFAPHREVLGREFDDAVLNEAPGDAIAAASAVYKNFLLEIGNADSAWIRYTDWLDRRMKKVSRLPMLRGMTDDEINRKIQLLVELGPEKAKMHRQLLSALVTELKMHQFNKVRGLQIVEEE